jgi:hypothetical protein
MTNYKDTLLEKMLIKSLEIKRYTNINTILVLLFLTDLVLALLNYVSFDEYYWSILVIILIGNRHMNIKIDIANEEFKELEKEYENLS